MTAVAVRGPGRASAVLMSAREPGPIRGTRRSTRNTPPPERSASLAARPSGPETPSNTSPAEWATMNHGGTPAASSEPMTEPADVPTM
jgi:hypothetical protein